MFDTPERPLPLQTRRFAVFAVILAACFALPLWQLFRFCLKSDFFSYIPLVPLISGYLIHLQRPNLPSLVRGTRGPAILCGVLGALILAVSIWARLSFQDLDRTSYLTGIVSGLLLSLLAAAFFLFGSKLLRLIAFPVAFMAFCIPLPDLLLDPISLFFQYTSAWTAVAFLRAVGTPVHLSDLTLDLSDIRITVAPECSGIHSTMVLL